ncbi:DUF5683 domain-containing protein [Sediminibacterium ginsengisoli]|nr:DUF5683 domain-containing protein [Sediminibacterium ginsengisoli]
MNAKLLSPRTDTTPARKPAPVTITDTSALKKKDSLPPVALHDPRKATRRSAIIPGWGQAYNKQYWKIPIVYGIIAIPVGLFIYNNNWYNKTKTAYDALYRASQGDSSGMAQIAPELRGLSAASVQSYRNAFRRDRDYSILWFLAAWGLQVADATVFGHLKQFDVSDDLSLNVKPILNTQSAGVGLTLSIKPAVKKQPIAR